MGTARTACGDPIDRGERSRHGSGGMGQVPRTCWASNISMETHFAGSRPSRSFPGPSLSASWALAEILSGQPRDLAALVLEADERQLRPLSAKLADDRGSIAILQQSFAVPNLPEQVPSERDRRAKRLANSGAALARLGHSVVGRGVFEAINDPAPRTYLIERLSSAGVPACALTLDDVTRAPAALSQTLILAAPASIRNLNLIRADAKTHLSVCWRSTNPTRIQGSTPRSLGFCDDRGRTKLSTMRTIAFSLSLSVGRGTNGMAAR